MRSTTLGTAIATALTLIPSVLAVPLGTQFTYQGWLTDSGSPYTGLADVRFQLFSVSAGGVALATSTHAGQTVTDGLFTVSNVQFGVTFFDGNDVYIEVAVRIPAGAGAYTPLSPRQRVAPTPYALQTRGLYVNPSLNVGIGTTAPADKLHVDGGNIRLTGASAAFEMFNFNGPPETETVQIFGTNAYNGGEIRLYSGTGLMVMYAANDSQQSGVLQLRNTLGQTRVQINGSNNDDGGAITVVAADGSTGVFIEGDGTNQAGAISVRNAAGASTVRLFGDSNGSGTGAMSVGEASPLAPMHVTRSGLSMLSSALNGEELVVEDGDAVLGLYSSTGGSYGATLALGEISGGALTNKWAMTRQTTAAGGELLLTYGTNANYGSNAVLFELATNGRLRLPSGGDVSPTGGGHLVTGSTTSTNIAIDNNEIMARNNGTAATLFLNVEGGAVVIGTTLEPAGAVLAVDGKVLCEELEVQLSGDWPDYVFAEDYSLMPLEQVESFIKQNRHLPDVPSAAEVKREGLVVGEMQAALMRKVEELTLHMIEQDKRLRTLETENARLRERVAGSN